jgi:hypothetical protein
VLAPVMIATLPSSRPVIAQSTCEHTCFEPRVDSFGDGKPPGVQHHVVAHTRENFRLGVVGGRGGPDFLCGETYVVCGP